MQFKYILAKFYTSIYIYIYIYILCTNWQPLEMQYNAIRSVFQLCWKVGVNDP